MTWEFLFSTAGKVALVGWLILAFAPRREWLMRTVLYGGIGVVSLAYAVAIIGLMTGLFNGGGSGGFPDFSTLASVKELLSTDGGATIGWIHYLAFDLFVGLWIAINADKYGFPRWIQVPILFFTLMLGPLGLTLYLLLRFTRHEKLADSVVPQ